MGALAVATGGIGYVQGGYVVALLTLALYALSLVARRRRLSRRLPSAGRTAPLSGPRDGA